jgi:ribosome-associated toxin RatA of RatAB toxin-antitoxin module
MTSLAREAFVPYTAAQMFELVHDVEHYVEFLPHCTKSTVLESTEEYMIASVEISALNVTKSFTTKNTFITDKQLTMTHVEGPFNHLVGRWDFENLGKDGCKISLQLDFDIKGGLKAMVFGMLFNKVADKLVDAFVKRAQTVYG